MWRALLFLGLICAGAYGAVWLANHPETVAVTWAGREYSTSLAVGVIGLIAVAIAISVLLGTLRYFFALPVSLRRGARRRREQKGLSALSRGIVAVGAGDTSAARRHATEAERLLGQQPLALLLKAQAAQASGNREAAESAFRDLAAKPETRVLGLRGLYLEAKRRGDQEQARHCAEEAAHLAPAVGWASDAVLEGLSADGDWAGAVRLVERRTSLGLIDRATSRRQRAVLLTADAMAKEARDPDGSLAAAQQAVKLAPDLVPAASLAARLLSRRSDLKRAAKVIETAWRATPHPDLAGAYLNLRPGDSASDRLARAETLARLSSWSAESRFAIARAAIESRELPRAREVLRPLLEDEGRPTVRLCMTMAEIEGRGGNPGGAREWLARAARAPRDKAWIAEGVVSETWAPVSPATGRIDAFRWETPLEAVGGPSEPEALVFDPPESHEPEELPALKLAAPSGEPKAASTETPKDVAGPPKGDAAAAPPPRPTPVEVLPEKPTVSAKPPEPEPAKPEPPARSDMAVKAEPSPKSVPDPKPGVASLAAALEPAKAVVPGPDRPDPQPSRSVPAGQDKPGSRGGPVAGEARAAEAAVLPSRDPAPESITGSAAPGKAQPRPPANGGAPVARLAAGREPEPVIFPVAHAPDDPGPEAAEDRRQRFRLRV